MKFCPRCGSDLVPGANFCYSCGYNLSIVQEEDDDDQPLEPVSQPSVIQDEATGEQVAETEAGEPLEEVPAEPEELPSSADDLKDEPEEETEPVVIIEAEAEAESVPEPEEMTVTEEIPEPTVETAEIPTVIEVKEVPAPEPYIPPAARPISPDWRTPIQVQNVQQEAGESSPVINNPPASQPSVREWEASEQNKSRELETEKSTDVPPAARPISPDWRTPYQSQDTIHEAAPVKPEPISSLSNDPPAGRPAPSRTPPAYQGPKSESYSSPKTGNINPVKRVIGLITHPVKEWEQIAEETPDRRKLITGYALILAFIPAIVTFVSYFFFMKDISFYYSITSALLRFLVPFGVLVLAAYISEYLAPSLESEKNFNRSFQLVCFAFTPVWVFFIIALFPAIRFLAIMLGFGYTWYLLYKGIPLIKKTPSDKALGYSILMILSIYFSYLIAYKVLEAILL